MSVPPPSDVANALAAFLTSLQRQSLNPVQLPQPVVVVQQPQQTAAPLAPSPTPPQQHPFLDSGPLTAFKCGQCINCFRQHNCEKCVNCLARRQPCLRRVCVQSGLIPMHQPQQQGQEARPPSKKTAGTGKKIGRPRKTAEEKAATKAAACQRAREARPRKQANNETMVVKKDDKPRQCAGPRCVLAARPGSKYCADECGLALARRRFDRLLASRVQDYYGQQPLWKVETEERIDQLRRLQTDTEEALKRVGDCAQNLELYFGTLASGRPAASRHSQSDEDTSFPHGCMVCGVEVPVRSLPKHVQRCFVRLEKQSTFGTAQKFPINPHNIVCERYDKQTKTYCKRLRVICSEHYRDEIGRQFRLCGYPLAWTRMASSKLEDMFLNMDILADGMCVNERKHCDQHFMWEQAALGVVENQRMQLLLKMDEVMDGYRRLAECHSTQRNAIALLMNSRRLHSALHPPVAAKVGPVQRVRVQEEAVPAAEDQEEAVGATFGRLNVQ